MTRGAPKVVRREPPSNESGHRPIVAPEQLPATPDVLVRRPRIVTGTYSIITREDAVKLVNEPEPSKAD